MAHLRFLLILIPILSISCSALLVAATAHHERVSDAEELWGGYRQQGVYVLTHDVFLEKQQGWTKFKILVAPKELVPVGQMEWPEIESVSEYESSKHKWPNVIGVVRTGTRLRVVDLWKRWTKTCSWLWVSAEILDGPYAGETVDIMDLSISVAELDEFDLLGPDPKVLKVSASEK